MLYKVTHFKKELKVETTKPFGIITVYFGSKTKFKKIGRISITKFMALSHILENDAVGYDPNNNVFETPVEASVFTNAPEGELT